VAELDLLFCVHHVALQEVEELLIQVVHLQVFGLDLLHDRLGVPEVIALLLELSVVSAEDVSLVDVSHTHGVQHRDGLANRDLAVQLLVDQLRFDQTPEGAALATHAGHAPDDHRQRMRILFVEVGQLVHDEFEQHSLSQRVLRQIHHVGALGHEADVLVVQLGVEAVYELSQLLKVPPVLRYVAIDVVNLETLIFQVDRPLGVVLVVVLGNLVLWCVLVRHISFHMQPMFEIRKRKLS